jgi:hypothetical protein
MCSSSWVEVDCGPESPAFGPRGNIFRRGWPVRLNADGSATLADQSLVSQVDAVMFCTGVLTLACTALQTTAYQGTACDAPLPT